MLDCLDTQTDTVLPCASTPKHVPVRYTQLHTSQGCACCQDHDHGLENCSLGLIIGLGLSAGLGHALLILAACSSSW